MSLTLGVPRKPTRKSESSCGWRNDSSLLKYHLYLNRRQLKGWYEHGQDFAWAVNAWVDFSYEYKGKQKQWAMNLEI
jgi:hypothetical protein